jgi:hypothetical protein
MADLNDMNMEQQAWQGQPPELSTVLITLLKGIIYRDDSQDIWRDLLLQQASVQDYTAVIGLDLIIDEAEGYAYLRSRQQDENGESSDIPRLVMRRQLSYPVSLLLALLRRKLVELDAQGSETRLVLARDEIAELVRIFLPEGSNEVKLLNQIDSLINKVVDLGFLRKLRGQNNTYEVRRIIKAYVDAQWLADFDKRLAEYQLLAGGVVEDEQDD